MKEVFILDHVPEFENGEEDTKFIGVYSSYEEAEKARTRAVKQPGFSDYPDGFMINLHILNHGNWTEGFFTVN